MTPLEQQFADYLREFERKWESAINNASAGLAVARLVPGTGGGSREGYTEIALLGTAASTAANAIPTAGALVSGVV